MDDSRNLNTSISKKKIVLIESPNIPTVGVGESTIVQINRWKTMLGIEDKDFMKHCDASYKLGIRFEDFYKKGDGGFSTLLAKLILKIDLV